MNNSFFSKENKNVLVIIGLTTLLSAIFFIGYDNKISAQAKNKPINKAALIQGSAVTAKLRMGTTELVRQIRRKGVNFRVTAQVESELRRAKLRDEVIAAARDNYRGAKTIVPAETTALYNTAGSTTNRKSNQRGGTAANIIEPEAEEETTAGDGEDKYDALYNQALSTSMQLFTPGIDQQRGLSIIQNARNLATQAIRLDKTRPEGYKIYAFTAFIAQNYSEAEKYCQDVIDRGGSVQFDIIHFHGNQPVKEVLYVDNESVSIEYEGGYNVFKYSEILSAQTKGMVPFGQSQAAVFSMNVNRNNEAFETFFIPSLRGTPQDAQLITRIINNNMGKNR